MILTDDVELLGYFFTLGCEDGLDVDQGTAGRESLVTKIYSLCTRAYIHTYIHNIYIRTYIYIHTY